MHRKQLAAILIGGLVLISGCSSIFPEGNTKKAPSAVKIADNASKKIGATDNISYKMNETLDVEQEENVQNLSGSGAVAAGGRSLKQEANITEQVYQDGKSVYRLPDKISLNVTFRQLSTREQEQIVQEYEHSEDKNRSDLEPFTVVRTIEAGGEWTRSEIHPDKQNATQMEAHESILSALADAEPSVTYRNGTAILTGKIPLKNLRSLYLATPGHPPDYITTTDMTPADIKYQIDTKTLKIQSFTYHAEREVEYNNRTLNETVSMSITYSDHNSTDVTIPENVTQEAQG